MAMPEEMFLTWLGAELGRDLPPDAEFVENLDFDSLEMIELGLVIEERLENEGETDIEIDFDALRTPHDAYRLYSEHVRSRFA
jgi:acyl carrier protein